jgi:zeaxanthin glucosyltransferase
MPTERLIHMGDPRFQTMKHIGLMCPVVSGHLNPMTTLGRALKRRGYRVSLIAFPDGATKAASSGLEFLPIGEIDLPIGTVPRQIEIQGELTGKEALLFVMQRYDGYSRAILRDAPGTFEKYGIEGVLIDEGLPAASAVAEALRLPWVTVSNAMTMVRESAMPPFVSPLPYDPTPAGCSRNQQIQSAIDHMFMPVLTRINDYRATSNLPPLASYGEAQSPLAHIVQQPASFDFPRESKPRNFHYTGPFHDDQSGDTVDFPFERLDGRPLIYASMGTINNRLFHLFPLIAKACAGLDAQVVLSLGRRGLLLPVETPADCLVVSYAPQRELLQRASLVITHAGLNTVLESLTFGVPLVAIPVSGDQPGVAARIKYLGLGEMVPIADLTIERLGTVVGQVWNGPEYRRRTRLIQQEIAQTNGIERAIDIAEQALTTGRPVWNDASASS